MNVLILGLKTLSAMYWLAEPNGKIILNSDLQKMQKEAAVPHFKALTQYVP
jgi:hypothetical protein